MDPTILFLLKSIAGGATGHYLKKGLEKIDQKLAEMFDQGADEKDIQEYVSTHDLESKIEGYAAEVAENSIIFPMISDQVPSLELKSEFFLAVIQTGMWLSHSWKIDLLLPGSFLGTPSLSLFRQAENEIPGFVRDGPKIVLTEGHDSYLSIIPFGDDKSVDEYWNNYKEQVLMHKSESASHMQYESPCRGAQISVVTARSVVFPWKASMPKDKQALLSFENISGTVAVGDWHQGIAQMLKGAMEIKELFVLPQSDLSNIEELTNHLRDISGET